MNRAEARAAKAMWMRRSGCSWKEVHAAVCPDATLIRASQLAKRGEHNEKVYLNRATQSLAVLVAPLLIGRVN